MANQTICQCCKQTKARVDARASELIRSMHVIMCPGCNRAGHEPRHMVVLAAKSRVDVSDYIKSRRYCGRTLEAIEVTP